MEPNAHGGAGPAAGAAAGASHRAGPHTAACAGAAVGITILSAGGWFVVPVVCGPAGYSPGSGRLWAIPVDPPGLFCGITGDAPGLAGIRLNTPAGAPVGSVGAVPAG